MASQDPRALSLPPRSDSTHPPSPGELPRLISSTVERNVRAELSPSDRILVADAEAKLMSAARTGFWVGTFVGGAVAFRGRFLAGSEGLRKGVLPRLFFPSAKEGKGSLREQLEAAQKAAEADAANAKEAAAKAAAESQKQGKAAFFGKAFGYGILGSVVGTQLGVWYGKSASARHIRASGREAAIEASIERGLQRASKELQENPAFQGQNLSVRLGGKIEAALGKGGEGKERGGEVAAIDGVGYEEPGRELEHGALNDGVGYSDRAPPQDHSPGNLSDPFIPSGSYRSSSSPDSSSSNRWDELRRSRAAPPSKWDELRQDRARSAAPLAGLSSSGRDEQPQPVDEKREAQEAERRGNEADKERRRREFEALFEKEARGGDDGMGEKTWR
ncbi:hypothetical protein JCM6882_006073 [Rhodosporidiobolus microsporus]